MSTVIKTYLIEYFEDSGTPEYNFYIGEDAYDAIADFREIHPKAQIQNVALVLDLDESVYNDE